MTTTFTPGRRAAIALVAGLSLTGAGTALIGAGTASARPNQLVTAPPSADSSVLAERAASSDRHLQLLNDEIMLRADGLYAHRGQRCVGNPIFVGPPCWV